MVLSLESQGYILQKLCRQRKMIFVIFCLPRRSGRSYWGGLKRSGREKIVIEYHSVKEAGISIQGSVVENGLECSDLESEIKIYPAK